MRAVVDTTRLVADGVIMPQAAVQIEARARQAMVQLAINAVLFLGILCATAGLIVWLASPLPVALAGIGFVIAGLGVLMRAGPGYAMFGHAAALIGGGLWMGGGALELTQTAPDSAGAVLLGLGALVAGAAAGLLKRFAVLSGAFTVMGAALHLFGLWWLLSQTGAQGGVASAAHLYTAAVLALVGWWCNVRLITALAIVPFAQALDTGTAYLGAAYVFYSPEPVLTILQMAALGVAVLLLIRGADSRTARHGTILVIMAFVVGNLSALVGSLFGDVVGDTLWGPVRGDETSADWQAAREAFEASTLSLSPDLFAVLWAAALVALVVWAAMTSRRGLFNAAMTFGAIHAYTQAFESFGDHPLAYVVGGLAAVPLAWGVWQVNRRWLARG